jgi:hypothetical protein
MHSTIVISLCATATLITDRLFGCVRIRLRLSRSKKEGGRKDGSRSNSAPSRVWDMPTCIGSGREMSWVKVRYTWIRTARFDSAWNGHWLCLWSGWKQSLCTSHVAIKDFLISEAQSSPRCELALPLVVLRAERRSSYRCAALIACLGILGISICHRGSKASSRSTTRTVQRRSRRSTCEAYSYFL